jgi:SAM-dependent methyltransferase
MHPHVRRNDMGLRRTLFARYYDRLMASSEEAGLTDIRAGVLGDATGRVLEIGAGTGLNLPHYPDAITSLTVTDPDPSMLRQLERAAARDERIVDVVSAPAEDLPFDDDSFDTVVSTLVLCGVDDQRRALDEIRRVLAPGGRFAFVEHVRSSDAQVARRQDRLNWLNRFVVGCECNRPTLEAIERAGLAVEHVDHGELPKSPAFISPMISGIARSPATS